jgi:Rrf2 family protein
MSATLLSSRSELDLRSPVKPVSEREYDMNATPQNDQSTEKCNSSMQLTRAADYAVRVMVHLATLPPEKRAFLPDLAQATSTPESFLSKVMQALAHAGLISSRRGKAGGFAILPHGREATMREVIEAIDGPICLNVCLSGNRDCERKSWCPAHPVWARAQRAMIDVLMNVTVSAMAAKRPTSHPSIGILPIGQPS